MDVRSTPGSYEFVTVVSGLPRSGTSMLMQMLVAGGLQTQTDGVREADEDNLNGYYEFESVKQLRYDHSWLADAKGKAVKVISELLKELPSSYSYKIIFIRRRMEEVLASQRQMLVRRGQTGVVSSDDDEEISRIFQHHLSVTEQWLSSQANMEVLYVDHADILNDPLVNARQITEFLGLPLNIGKMAEVVDDSLYRQRS